MTSILRSPRAIYWFLKSFLSKQNRFVVLGFILGFLLIVYWYSGFSLSLRNLITPENSVGLIGKYNLSNLPLSLQNKISLGLMRLTEDDQATPAAALSYEIKNEGKSYVFKLNPNLVWQDGKKFTAFDVNYRLKDVEIRALGNETVEFKLKEPFASLPFIVSQPLFRKGLIGLGSYKVEFSKVEQGNIVQLNLRNVVNSNDRIIYKFYDSEKEAFMALKLKKIARIEEWQNFTGASNNRDFLIKDINNYHQIIMLFFNTKKDPFTEKTIRNGLSYAVPDEIKNLFTRASGPIPKTSWYYHSNLKEYNENKTQAANYLKGLTEKEATRSSVFQIMLDTLPAYKELAEKIAKAWTATGIKTMVHETATSSPDYDVFLAAIEVSADPDQYYLWHSTQTSNIANFKSARIDKILEDARQISDDKDRRAKYLEFQRYLVEENPVLFLFYGKSYTVSRL